MCLCVLCHGVEVFTLNMPSPEMWSLLSWTKILCDTSVQESKSSDGQNSYPPCGACFLCLDLPLLGKEGLPKVTLGAFRNKGVLIVLLSKGWCLIWVGGWLPSLCWQQELPTSNLSRKKKIQWCWVWFSTEGTKALTMFCSYLKSTARSLSPQYALQPKSVKALASCCKPLQDPAWASASLYLHRRCWFRIKVNRAGSSGDVYIRLFEKLLTLAMLILWFR